MATGTLTVRIELRWWLMPYLHTLLLLCDLLDCEPDLKRLERAISRGTVVRAGASG